MAQRGQAARLRKATHSIVWPPGVAWRLAMARCAMDDLPRLFRPGRWIRAGAHGVAQRAA